MATLPFFFFFSFTLLLLLTPRGNQKNKKTWFFLIGFPFSHLGLSHIFMLLHILTLTKL